MLDDIFNLKYLQSDGFAADRDVMRLQDNPFNNAAVRQGRPMSDPLGNAGMFRHGPEQNNSLIEGIIVDSSSLANVYKVFLPGARAPQVGFLLSHSSSAVFGAKDLATLSPGTAVLCVRMQNMAEVCILGVMPPPGGSASASLQAVLHGASRQRVDRCHHSPIEMSSGSQVKSFLNRRLFDSIGGGEAGWVTETGMRMFIDPFLATIGLDEASNLSFFHFDKLARLVAKQWQLWTGVSETEAFNDQGELTHWTGYAQYHWEQLGRPQAASIVQVRSSEDWQQNSPVHGKVDLAIMDARPHHREVEWHGYLGQGHKRSLYGKPASVTRYAAGADLSTNVGLADHFVTLDGQMCWQSVRGFSMVKQAVISLPSRIAKPEARTGDNETNYNFGGVSTATIGVDPDLTREHIITGDLTTTADSGQKSASRAAGSLDRHAYLFNLKGVHPFVYHKQDYTVPEISAFTPSTIVPAYGSLQASQQIDPEGYRKEVAIDHRFNSQPVYSLPAGLDILPDGTVLIFDGAGSEIRMCQGEIHITAPAGVFLKSGKTVAILGGDDVIVKARNSLDLTATNKDIRIKAQHNLEMLAGVDTTGGVLIESKSYGSDIVLEAGEDMQHPGITLKSPESQVVIIGSELYQRTTSGSITLDADKGGGEIITYASKISNFVSGGESWLFELTESDEGISVGGATAVLSASQLSIAGGLFVKGDSMLGGSVTVGQTIAAGSSVSGLKFNNTDGSAGQEAIAQNREAQAGAKKAGQSDYDTLLDEASYQEGKRGADDIMSQLGFCFRTDEQYGSVGFFMFEDRWQQLARLTEQHLPEWVEPPVAFMEKDYYPFPGKLAYTGTAYKQQDTTITDVTTGTPLDRRDVDGKLTDPYVKAKHGIITGVSFDRFSVIVP